MTGFATLLAESERLADGLVVEVPDAWLQGRTAYGGFSSALCLAVAQGVGGEGLPPLRSAQLAMMAPVYGTVSVRARIERQGRNATWMSAEIHGDKGPAFAASLVFMGPVASALHLNHCAAPANALTAAQAPAVTYTRHTPAFLANNFEARHGIASDGEKRPELCRWVRLNEREGLDPMVELLLVADALPPGVMPMMPAIVPVSTMHWQVDMLTPAPVSDDGWWLLRSVGDYAEQGCSSQRMDAWGADSGGADSAGAGLAPVLGAMQSIALFG